MGHEYYNVHKFHYELIFEMAFRVEMIIIIIFDYTRTKGMINKNAGHYRDCKN